MFVDLCRKALRAHPLWAQHLSLDSALTVIGLVAGTISFGAVAEKVAAMPQIQNTPRALTEIISVIFWIAFWLALLATVLYLVVMTIDTIQDVKRWRKARKYTREQLIELVDTDPDFRNWAQIYTIFDGICFVANFEIIRPRTNREWGQLALAAVIYAERQPTEQTTS